MKPGGLQRKTRVSDKNLFFGDVVTKIVVEDYKLNEFWNQFPDIKLFIEKMNAVEHWVLDDIEREDSVQDQFVTWARNLDDQVIQKLESFGNELLVILGLMSTSRSIFVLNQLTEHCGPLTNHLTTLAIHNANHEELGRFSTIFLDRITATETQGIFQSIFEPDRLARIYESIKKTSEEVGQLYD